MFDVGSIDTIILNGSLADNELMILGISAISVDTDDGFQSRLEVRHTGGESLFSDSTDFGVIRGDLIDREQDAGLAHIFVGWW